MNFRYEHLWCRAESWRHSEIWHVVEAMGYHPRLINLVWIGIMQDPILKMLVSLANSAGVETGITLHTSTGVISGMTISQKNYFEEIANGFANAWPGGPNEDIRTSFLSIGGAADEHDELTNEFIHLKDARVVSAGGFLPSSGEGAYWRGKVESVTGFHLGSYKP
ncbi:gas vesicle accessory protein GvpU [Pseudomonas sp. NUPR-001]|uniref:gas vesicle accessory protein GvpU n=1 Tax=Pseudomonas sp. NUPR-001 TaxID=3416058 RepID=UPI003F9CD184